jgi:RNA polymerase sigma-70 factor, ECF subfamily
LTTAGRDLARQASATQAGAEPGPGASAAMVPPFAKIYQDYFDFVWSSARRLGVSADAIDDVVQEAFVVIHSKVHTLQQPQALRSWIYGVVRRTVSGYHRSRRAKALSGASLAFFEEARESNQATPLELTERSDQLTLLASLLNELDEPKREVFVLAELEEMPVPEIAEALEIPLNTAYSRLRAARQAFEEGLARRTAREKGGGRQ